MSVDAAWLSLITCKDSCIVVHARPSDDPSVLLHVVREQTWPADLRNKSVSYPALRRTVSEYVAAQKIDAIVLKRGRLGQDGRGRASIISAAELRGVIYTACDQSDIFEMDRSVVSKTYGDKKVGDYLCDSLFWNERVSGIGKSKLHREATLLLIAAVDRFDLIRKSPRRQDEDPIYQGG